jgi:glyoxylase-like metal-dependent hydrolase (beta-lactamase superfamily II)
MFNQTPRRHAPAGCRSLEREVRTSVDLGGYSAEALRVQSFMIDGGAMYGVVPRLLWERFDPPDDANRVSLDINLFLLRTPSGPMLVDSGFGDVITEQQQKMYRVETYETIEKALSRFDLSVEDITTVVLTHLHFDHSGGVVTADTNGKSVPRFPRARHVVQVGEWEDCQHPNERTAATYLPERLEAVERAGLFDLVVGDAEVVPGVRVIKTGGHTEHHQAVYVDGGDAGLVAPGDIVPTRHHLRLPYIAGVDTHPLETLGVKRDMLTQIVEEDRWLASDHDKVARLSRLSHDEKGRIVPAEG